GTSKELGYMFVGDIKLTNKAQPLDKISTGEGQTVQLDIPVRSCEATSARNAGSQSGFVLSIDGIILNSVGELLFERVDKETIRDCRRSYQRALEDFAFAVLYGTQIASKWQPKTQQSDKPTSAPLGPAETLISRLPDGLYGFESFDADLRDGALLK